METMDPAQLVAEDVSDISWEDLIDEMQASPSAHIIETGVCNSGSDPSARCDTLD